MELHPYPLYAADGATRMPTLPSCRSADHKDRWLPEQSTDIRYFEHKDIFSAIPSDGTIAVRTSALEGADIWCDRRLKRNFFFSDRLYRAMSNARIQPLDAFYRCRMIDPSA